MAQKPTIPQGTRDFGPQQVQRRKYILQIIESVFKKYGFMPLETPAMENLSSLTGKYGDEGDQLLFKVLNSGDYFKKLIIEVEQTLGQEQLDPTFLPSLDGKISSLDSKRSLPFISEKGLRYDLTVPFARYVVMNRNEITFPFKRFQMQPVWRADRPQKGRYREFWQCDADVVGSNGLISEAELIKVYDEVFAALGIPVVIKLNNRKILSALATLIDAPNQFINITVAIDKLDKIGIALVAEELSKNGLNLDQTEKVITFLKLVETENPLHELEKMFKDIPEGKLGCEELRKVFDFLSVLSVQNEVKIDVTLARGLSYYTGAIMEVQANKGDFKSSIGGGGRYDNLTGIFGLPDVSGVGISFGLDRIYDVLEGLNLFPKDVKPSSIEILFCYFDEESQLYALKQAAALRVKGVAAEVYPDVVKKIGKQLDYANKLQIPYACIIGSNEMQSGKLKLKNLIEGKEEELEMNEILTRFIS